MTCGVRREQVPNASGKSSHVLIVVEDRNPLALLMCGYAFETLEHFEPCDRESTRGPVSIRQHGAPDRMRMQNRIGCARAGDFEVQQRFRGGLPESWLHRCAAGINFYEPFARQGALRDATARHQ